MEPADLLNASVRLIKAYNPAIADVDTHILNELGEFDAEREPDKVFMQQVFYGCIRYQKMLKVFLSSFYFNNSGSTSRQDYTLFMVLAYLSLFRLKELGMAKFRLFLESQDCAKMHIFLSYLFNMHNVNVWLKEEWCKLLDRTYVEGTIIGGIQQFMTDITEWQRETHDKAFGAEAQAEKEAADEEGTFKLKRSTKPLTKPVAPNLTAPRMKLVPEPERIPQVSVARPVPETIHQRTMAVVAEESERRRAKVAAETSAKYSPKDQFKLHETKSNIEQLRQEVEHAEMQECMVEFKAKPMPQFTAPAQVRLTAAAILREDALLKKKQQEDAKLIKEYEANLRDNTEFVKWQTEVKSQDEAARQRQVEERRLEMAASAQDAVEAKERNKLEKHMMAQLMREEASLVKQTTEAEAQALLDENRAMVDEIRDVRARAPREAEAKVLAERQERYREIEKEKAEAAARRAREQAEEQAIREDLIRQIRALERVPKIRVAEFDPTEVVQHGLLEEMSLVALKETLAAQKAQEAEDNEAKRQEILREKREKEQGLRGRLQNIARIREAASSSNREARARRKANEEQKQREQDEARKASNMRLAERLAAKRAAREAEAAQLQEEEARVAKQRMFLGAAKSAIEERHFDELMHAAGRKAKSAQEAAKHEQRRVEAAERADRQADKAFVKKKRIDQRKRWAASDAAAKAKKPLAEQRAIEDMRKRRDMFMTRTAAESKVLETRDALNEYAATINHKNIENARTMRGAPSREDMLATKTVRRNARMGLTSTGDSVVQNSTAMARSQRPGSGQSVGRGTTQVSSAVMQWS